MRPLVLDLKVENVSGGHWLQLEKADEVNKILEEFMEEKRLIKDMSAQNWELMMQKYQTYIKSLL